MKNNLLRLLLLLTAFLAAGPNVNADSRLNRKLYDDWQTLQVAPAEICDDPTFCRRIYLDLTGRIPTIAELDAFCSAPDADKREKLVDKLLCSDDFTLFFTMRLCEMLRIKSEFPINLWPNAVYAVHDYLRHAVSENRTWYQLTRELLTINGSNFRCPAANFFRAAADRTPAGLAKNTLLTFMGLRYEQLPESGQQGVLPFFSCIRSKKTLEWKEEVIFDDLTPGTLKAVTPDGRTIIMNLPDDNPREIFCRYLQEPDNPYYAPAMVNRLWQQLFGRGQLEPVDDLPVMAPATRAALPQSFAFLVKEFQKSSGDIRELLRLILNSRAYQSQHCAPGSDAAAPEKYFCCYPIRRLQAEVIVDVLSGITGSYENYHSVIPEPFTYIPPKSPAISLADGSITSRALENFGRSPRDTGLVSESNLNITSAQRRYLLNSQELYRAIKNRCNSIPGTKAWSTDPASRQLPDYIYKLVLSRPPTPEEIEKCRDYCRRHKFSKQSIIDLFQALINSSEFLYHH